MANRYPKLSKILKRLLFERNMNAVDLAKATNLHQPTVSRIVSGTSARPYDSSLIPIANYFSISVEQLKGIEPLPDEIFSNSLATSKPSLIELPILSWEQVENKTLDFTNANTIAATNDIPAECFAVEMNDSSMAPTFRKDTILIFNPAGEYVDNSFVLVKLANTKVIFRQLIVDADDKYLKALSPNFTSFPIRLLSDEDEIIGELVEARQSFKPKKDRG